MYARLSTAISSTMIATDTPPRGPYLLANKDGLNPIRPRLPQRFSAAAVELHGALYVVGGYDGNYLNSAERLDPREVSWSRLPSMNTRRGSHSVAVLNGKIYVLGGFEESFKMVSSVEVFDPRIGSWVMDDAMKQTRGYCFTPVIGDTIFAIGGMKERGVFRLD